MTIDDLTPQLTPDQIRLAIFNVLVAVGVTTSNWKPGAVVRTIITGVSIVLAGLSGLISLLARSSFLALSSGDWLKLVALYVYGVTRIEATFASGFVTLTNVSGANYTLDPGDLTVVNPTTNKTYFNTSTFTLSGSSTLVVPIQAFEAGSDSTSFAGEITVVQTALDGVSCTNALAVAGHDVESDPALRARCTAKLGSLSPNGPRDAYDYVAKSATRPDGSSIGVTRTKVTRLPGGILQVYVAGASGPIPGTVGDLSSDLGLIDDALQRAATPLGITLNTLTVAIVALPVTYEAWLLNTSSMSPAQMQSAILDQLELFAEAQPIGGFVIPPASGKVYLSALETSIMSATDATGARLPFVKVAITFPVADAGVSSNAIVELGTITCTRINLVPAGGA